MDEYGREHFCIQGCKYCPIKNKKMIEYLKIDDRGPLTYSYGLDDIELFTTRGSLHITCTSDCHDHNGRKQVTGGVPISVLRNKAANWWVHANTHNPLYVWTSLLSLYVKNIIIINNIMCIYICLL